MENETKRRDLCRLVWDTVSPTWDFDDATFERTAAAFKNPDRDMFTGPYAHRTLQGIGHNLPQEAPTAFAQAVVDADHL
jgi:pimeloyl-ACP methyl ester carboxylesterase